MDSILPLYYRDWAILAGGYVDGRRFIECPKCGRPGVLAAPKGAGVRLVAQLAVVHTFRQEPGDRKEDFRGFTRHAHSWWVKSPCALPRKYYGQLYRQEIGEVHGKGLPVARSRLRDPALLHDPFPRA